LACIALLVVCSVFSAQATTSIRGRVLDPQEAVVQGASVTLEHVSTRAIRNSSTDNLGSYQFLQLPPGTYRVMVEFPGFMTVVYDNVELLVNTPMTHDLKFVKVGEISETLTVTEPLFPAINAIDASIGNAIQNSQVLALPLESRNVSGLLSLQTGVVYTGIVD